ncbi:MAG: ABC transporter permease [Myxococcales bacterium]|nr:ABC transporter permease [Myxococcales bacterium]
MKLSRMAWRNVWRNSRRSWVTICAMSIGLLVMIEYAGLVRGYLQQMERQILEVEIGDVQIHAKGYRDDPSLFIRMSDSDAVVTALEAAGFKVSPRLLGAGLAAAADNSSGAMLLGLDPKRDAAVSKVSQMVAKGQWLDATKPGEAVIGRWLARTLELTVGGEIVVLSQAADGSTANEVYKIRGILGSVGHGIDRGGVFLTSDAFRELMSLPKGAHRIIVRIPTDMSLSQAELALKPLAAGHEVKTWKALLPVLAQMFEATQGAMTIMFLIIFVAVGIVLLNTMLMAVFERVQEIGILKALGFSPFSVLRLIFIESGIQTAISVAIGVLLSIPATWYMTEHGLEMGPEGGISLQGVALARVWYAAPSVDTLLLPIFVLLFVIFFAVLYPAVKAAVIRPVEAIRHR